MRGIGRSASACQLVGVAGAILGGGLLRLIGVEFGGIMGSLVTALIGAVVLLYVIRLVKKKRGAAALGGTGEHGIRVHGAGLERKPAGYLWGGRGVFFPSRATANGCKSTERADTCALCGVWTFLYRRRGGVHGGPWSPRPVAAYARPPVFRTHVRTCERNQQAVSFAINTKCRLNIGASMMGADAARDAVLRTPLRRCFASTLPAGMRTPGRRPSSACTAHRRTDIAKCPNSSRTHACV